MEIYEIYKQLLNEETYFNIQQNEDRVEINLISNGNVVGNIILDFVMGGYWEFEDEMSEDRYDEIFPDDKFVKIEHIEVKDEYKGRGFAKQLMNKAIEYAKKMGETVIYLNASPMGFSGLSINDLVGFYKSFGFKTIIDDYDKNKEMIKYI